MIIKKINAKNVLKYQTLELCNIPTTGLVAISGPNESGKSTIGETLCFAFFGRTFSLGEQDLQKIIRWGETQCNVTVDFEVDGIDYRLNRSLDKQGNHSARLSRSDSPDQALARGVDAVKSALLELLGYAFEEFIESFYLAQREINTPNPQSQAVKIMAGIAPLERVSHEMEREIAEQGERLQGIDAEISANNSDLQDLGLETGRLSRLQARREELFLAGIQNAEEEESLTDLSTRYTVVLGKWKRDRIRLSALRLVGIALFLITVLGGALWAILTYGPDYQVALAEQVRSLVVQLFAGFQNHHIPQIGYVAAGLAVLTIFSWMGIAGRTLRINQLAKEGSQLAEQLASAREIVDDLSDEELADRSLTEPIQLSSAEAVDEVPSSETTNEDAKDSDNPVRADRAAFTSIYNQIIQMAASPVTVRDFAENEQAWLKALLLRQDAATNMLDSQIEGEQVRLRKADHLHEIAQELEQKRSACVNEISLREATLDLIDGNKEELSSRFNRDLKDQVGLALPLFTKERYEHLQISEDFKVRVFSSEKRDFMDLDEVSSGTQRQIMLAIRLTLAEQLLSRTVKGRQFAFLDEPFAFFDEARTQESLRGLSRFSAAVSQIFIVAQTFPKEDVDFALKIDCHHGQQVMTADGETTEQAPLDSVENNNEKTAEVNNSNEEKSDFDPAVS